MNEYVPISVWPLALLALLVALTPACVPGNSETPDAVAAIIVQSLDPSSEVGITDVRIEVQKIDEPSLGLSFEQVVSLSDDDDVGATFRLLPGTWDIRAQARDERGDVWGEDDAVVVLEAGRRAEVRLTLPLSQGQSLLEGSATVCHLHMPSIVGLPVVPPNGIIDWQVLSQVEVEAIDTTVLDSLGIESEPSFPMVQVDDPSGPGAIPVVPPGVEPPETLTWQGHMVAPAIEGIYFVELTSHASSYPSGCQSETQTVAVFVDDPATEYIGASSHPGGVTLIVSDTGGATSTTQIGNREAFAPIDPVLPNRLVLDELSEANDISTLDVCSGPGSPCSGDECGSASDETQSMPPSFDNTAGTTWRGARTGGCGTWSTLMCNRILGIDGDGDGNAIEAVDEAEWNAVAREVDPDGDGASSGAEEAAYYLSRGCFVRTRLYYGTPDDLDGLSRLHADGTDIKLRFGRAVYNSDGEYTGWEDGHVETVTSVDTAAGTVTTNSWGHTATISGGTDSNFQHSRDAAGRWPANGTRVYFQIVWCP